MLLVSSGIIRCVKVVAPYFRIDGCSLPFLIGACASRIVYVELQTKLGTLLLSNFLFGTS